MWRAAYYRGTKYYAAAVTQRTQYYPSGLPWSESLNSDAQKRKYNGKEFVETNGYDMYDYDARGMYPALARFTTVDPLAEKYYSVSPYAYCAGNPVKYVDINGREKLAYFHLPEVMNIIASKYPDDKNIHIFAHSNQNRMRLQHYIGNNDVLIQNAKGLKILLDNDSETWKNRKEGESLVIVLHGCNLANDEDGTPLAQRISESLIFKDMIIIAPNEELLFKTDGEYIGVYDKNNDMGDWLVYKNGKLVKKIPGDQMPTDDNIQDAQTHNNQNNNRHAWKDMTSILQSWMSQNPNIKWTIIY